MLHKTINCCDVAVESVDEKSGKSPSRVLDLLGILAAAVCLIHCLALPVVMTFLPTLIHAHHGHEHNDPTHMILAGWVLLFCLTAIVPGFVKHGYRRILLLMLIGLSAVLTATFHSHVGLAESVEIPLITLGNLLIITAHMYNRKLLKAVSS